MQKVKDTWSITVRTTAPGFRLDVRAGEASLSKVQPLVDYLSAALTAVPSDET
jgi:hypothetical protein